MKKKFMLTDYLGQKVMVVQSESKEKAIKYFSVIKNLSVVSLLFAFQVIEVED